MEVLSYVAFCGHKYIYKLVKACSLLFLLSFLWLQIRITSFKSEFPPTKEERVHNIISNLNITATPSDIVPFSIAQLKFMIEKSNADQVILNRKMYSSLEPEDVIVVVQVHRRVQYLFSLIESLRKAQGIENTLLIFSHDFYDPNINSLVQSIDFCKVVQIFYPHSIQLHPHEFPGQDPNDCPRDIPKRKALKKGCENANYPDLYGHYREASFTQTKHHWWWKINFIMDGLVTSKDHRGPVVFLEEDHYVSPDLLPYLSNMLDLKKNVCPRCNIICLGSYTQEPYYAGNSPKVERIKWHSSKHNMGIVLDREIWNLIRKCSEMFCQFDDYNWDWSLQRLGSDCLPQPLITLVPLATRVFHIGECGIHHKGIDCSSANVIEKVVAMLTAAKSHLYPDKLYLHHRFLRQPKQPKINGGWGDARDHKLCLSHVITP